MRRLARVLLDVTTIGCLLGAGAILLPFWWVTDLVASLASVVGVVALIALVASLPLRRVWVTVASVVVLVVVVVSLAGGRARRGDRTDWTILQCNASSGAHPDPLSMLDGLRDADADVCVLVEIPAPLVRAIREGALDDVYPTRLERRPTRHEASWIMVLSRFEGRAASTDEARPGLLACDLEVPGGAVRLVAFQATSPRSVERWREGNRIVREVASWVEGPTIAAGDLNATPSGRRSRLLGLRRGAPVLSNGTFPSWSPWRLRIDDVFMNDGFGVTSWRSLDMGSDHRAILVGIESGV